jgi:HSP20 family protein
MARDTKNAPQEATPQQSQNPSVGKSPTTSQQEHTQTERGDRQRTIQTQNDSRPSSLRRQTSSQVRTPNAASLTPFALMRRMAEDMDRLFDDFGFGRSAWGVTPALDTGFGRDMSAFANAAWSPQIESFRKGDKLVVRADLPGLRKEDVNVEVDDGVLTISGERTEEHEEDRDDYYRSERSYGHFFRALPLPEGVSNDQCDATFKDGVLEVTLAIPKETPRRAKQIPIR